MAPELLHSTRNTTRHLASQRSNLRGESLTRIRLFTALLTASLLLAALPVAAQDVPVTLRWTAPADGAPVEHYRLYYSTDGAEFRLHGTVDDTVTVVDVEPGVEYRFRVSGVSPFGLEGVVSEMSDVVYVPEQQQDDGGPPAGPDLRPNYPNPFNPETKIRYGLPESHTAGSRVALEIFDVRGQRVRSLPTADAPGWHEVTWDGRGDDGTIRPSGHYVVRLVADGKVTTWKMTMVK